MRTGPAPGLNLSYSLERRFIWLRIARNATRSVQAVLRAGVGDYRRLDRTEPLTGEVQALMSGPHLAFAVVRDPWARLVSAWRSKVRDATRGGFPTAATRRLQALPEPARRAATRDFAAFVHLLPDLPALLDERHFMPQWALLGGIRLDRVCRFESLVHDVSETLALVDVPVEDALFPRIGAGPRDPLDPDAWYTPEAARTVAEIYAEDARRWGYVGPFPTA